MPTPPLPTRAQIDQAAPLTFPDQKPADRNCNIEIAVTPAGLAIRVEYTGTLASIPQAIERLKAAGVLELVQTSAPAQPAATTPTTRAPAERVTPTYNSAGDACCPVHRRKLSEGDYGLFCSAKAKDGQVADKKGYCGLKFEE